MNRLPDALGAVAATRMSFLRDRRKSTSHWVFANDMAAHAVMVSIGTMTDYDISPPVQRTVAEERAYLLKRAEDHRRLAIESAEPGARSLHMRFQHLYLARALGDLDSISELGMSAKIPGTLPVIDG